jgi:hypothetical protein
MRVGVVHHHVQRVATGALVEALVALTRRTEHHVLVPQLELGVCDAAVLAVMDRIALEAERPPEEVDRGVRVVVLEDRIDALHAAKVPCAAHAL